MVEQNDASSIRQTRLRELGSDEDALEQRRMVEKLIRTGDELAVPTLVTVLDNHLIKPSRRSTQAAVKGAIGLGKLCRSGAETHKSKSYPTGTTVENLLVRALRNGSNTLQCAAADALARIGGEQARKALTEQAGGDGQSGDKNATVRARAKIALRRLQLRSGLHRKIRTADQIESIIRTSCDGTDYKLEPSNGGFTVKVALPGDRKQTIHIKTKNVATRKLPDGTLIRSEYVLMYTPCGPAKPEHFEKILKLNALKLKSEGFATGSLGLYQGQIVMIETQSYDSVDEKEVRTGIQVLAMIGDEIEKQITDGEDKR